MPYSPYTGAFLHTGTYKYTQDRLALDACRPASKPSIAPALELLHTPINLQAWEAALADNFDRFLHHIYM